MHTLWKRLPISPSETHLVFFFQKSDIDGVLVKEGNFFIGIKTHAEKTRQMRTRTATTRIKSSVWRHKHWLRFE